LNIKLIHKDEQEGIPESRLSLLRAASVPAFVYSIYSIADTPVAVTDYTYG